MTVGPFSILWWAFRVSNDVVTSYLCANAWQDFQKSRTRQFWLKYPYRTQLPIPGRQTKRTSRHSALNPVPGSSLLWKRSLHRDQCTKILSNLTFYKLQYQLYHCQEPQTRTDHRMRKYAIWEAHVFCKIVWRDSCSEDDENQWNTRLRTLTQTTDGPSLSAPLFANALIVTCPRSKRKWYSSSTECLIRRGENWVNIGSWWYDRRTPLLPRLQDSSASSGLLAHCERTCAWWGKAVKPTALDAWSVSFFFVRIVGRSTIVRVKSHALMLFCVENHVDRPRTRRYCPLFAFSNSNCESAESLSLSSSNPYDWCVVTRCENNQVVCKSVKSIYAALYVVWNLGSKLQKLLRKQFCALFNFPTILASQSSQTTS